MRFFKGGILSVLVFAGLGFGQGLQFKQFYDFKKVSFRAMKAKTIWMDEVPGMPQHFWVLDQSGFIYSLYPEKPVTDPKAINPYTSEKIADFSARCSQAISAEWGAWGISFHPKFLENKKFYIIFIDPNGGPWGNRSDKALTTVEEWVASGDKNEILKKTRTIWTYNHKLAYGVASMTFGKDDGFLYIANSDYGVDGHDLKTMGRKVLRIDVDRKDPGKEYAVPSDNPFVGRTDGTHPEIWSYGIRNVWGIHSHAITGEILTAEIGQEQWEEINLIKKATNGGWADGGNGITNPGGGRNHYGQGFSGPCHPGNTKNCDQFEDPFWAFPRGSRITDPKGGVAVHTGTINDNSNYISMSCVMGGRTFLGSKESPLYGQYIFADTRWNKMYAIASTKNRATYKWNGPNLTIEGVGPKYLGQSAEKIGDEVMGNSDGHDGIVNLGMDSYGYLYGVFVSWYKGASFHEIYRIEHPGMLPRRSGCTDPGFSDYDSKAERPIPCVGSAVSLAKMNRNKLPFSTDMVYPGAKALTLPAGAGSVELWNLGGRKVWSAPVTKSDQPQVLALPSFTEGGVLRVIIRD